MPNPNVKQTTLPKPGSQWGLKTFWSSRTALRRTLNYYILFANLLVNFTELISVIVSVSLVDSQCHKTVETEILQDPMSWDWTSMGPDKQDWNSMKL